MASQFEITAELKRLFAVLPLSRGIELDAVLSEALRVFVPFEASHLHEAVSRFIDGEGDAYQRRTAPKVPELASMVRQVRTEHAAADQKALRQSRQIAAPPAVDPGEKVRMRLKMPLWAYAFRTGQMDQLATALPSFEAMVVLANKWGIPVPKELSEGGERDLIERNREWNRAHARGNASMEDAPFYKAKVRAEEDNRDCELLFEGVGLDQWTHLSKTKQVPTGARWVASLGRVYGPKPVEGKGPGNANNGANRG